MIPRAFSVLFLPPALKRPDQSLFFKLNGRWHNDFFDAVMPFIREPAFWVPFYFFLIFFTLINFPRTGLIWILFLVTTVVIADFVSSSIVKEMFPRLRPCRDPEIAHRVRFLASYCGFNSSFVSSHAVNHFAISTFIFVTFKNAISPKWGFIFLWALLVCYAQVYVGVHYPLDVMAGAILGIVLGYVSSAVFNRYFPLPVRH